MIEAQMRPMFSTVEVHITKPHRFLVRRSDLRGLPDQAHAAIRGARRGNSFEREIDVESGDGFQFVERSAVWPSPRPLIIGTVRPAGGDNGRKDDEVFRRCPRWSACLLSTGISE